MCILLNRASDKGVCPIYYTTNEKNKNLSCYYQGHFWPRACCSAHGFEHRRVRLEHRRVRLEHCDTLGNNAADAVQRLLKLARDGLRQVAGRARGGQRSHGGQLGVPGVVWVDCQGMDGAACQQRRGGGRGQQRICLEGCRGKGSDLGISATWANSAAQ
jgi:hypothetical protein